MMLVDLNGREPGEWTPGEDTGYVGVYYLNSENGAYTFGHSALLFVREDGSGTFYNEIVESKDVVSNYLTIHDDKLWYITHKGILYQYDLSTKEKTKIMEHLSRDAVVMPETGLVAYTKGTQIEKIYLNNILTQKTICMTEGGWNTYFGQLSWTNSRWSDKGNEFFMLSLFQDFFTKRQYS